MLSRTCRRVRSRTQNEARTHLLSDGRVQATKNVIVRILQKPEGLSKMEVLEYTDVVLGLHHSALLTSSTTFDHCTARPTESSSRSETHWWYQGGQHHEWRQQLGRQRYPRKRSVGDQVSATSSRLKLDTTLAEKDFMLRINAYMFWTTSVACVALWYGFAK